MNHYTAEKPLLMIPGPVESSQHVLDATSERTYSHTEQEFVNGFQQSLQNLKQVFDVSTDYSPVVVAGGGTLAMEIALINLIDTSRSQKILVCETGYFGTRYETLAHSFQLKTSKITAEIGHAITEDQLRGALQANDVDFACIQHVDTSTGVANDIEMFARVCKEFGVISIVDGVCALGGQELHQEDWSVDIYLTGAQKALALPPGLAILMYSQQARKITESRENKIPSYYSDLDNWWPIMDAYSNGEVKYFSTPATNLIMGLRAATTELLNEGMDQVYSRHKRLASKFRTGLEELGFDFLTHTEHQAVTMTTPKYLDKELGQDFRKKVLSEGVLIAGGIQKGVADTYFRVGHMGKVSEDDIGYTLAAIENSL